LGRAPRQRDETAGCGGLRPGGEAGVTARPRLRCFCPGDGRGRIGANAAHDGDQLEHTRRQRSSSQKSVAVGQRLAPGLLVLGLAVPQSPSRRCRGFVVVVAVVTRARSQSTIGPLRPASGVQVAASVAEALLRRRQRSCPKRDAVMPPMFRRVWPRGVPAGRSGMVAAQRPCQRPRKVKPSRALDEAGAEPRFRSPISGTRGELCASTRVSPSRPPRRATQRIAQASPGSMARGPGGRKNHERNSCAEPARRQCQPAVTDSLAPASFGVWAVHSRMLRLTLR